jgi:hypothetical protein
MAEGPSQVTTVGGLESWPREEIFDLRWAITVTERALLRLGQECENCGRRRMFSILSKYLTTDRAEVSYANLSTSLGVPGASVKRLLHHLRDRYRTDYPNILPI